MSEILNLAQEMERKQKKNQDIMLKSQKDFMMKMSQSYKNSIKKNQQETENYMRQNSKIGARLMLKTWSFLLLTILLIASLGGGVTWYTGQLITENMSTISAQRRTIQHLDERMFGIELFKEKGVRYIALPVGYTGIFRQNTQQQTIVELIRE